MMIATIALLFLCLPGPDGLPRVSCLPAGTKSTDIVSAELTGMGKGGDLVRKTTVAQELKALKARCRKGVLVDGKGRKIRFYRLKGCWGNPPLDYLQIMERQRNELDELKKRYTVIEMTCNPSGLPIP